MKKLFLLTALLAVTLFTSCQKEEINPDAGQAKVIFSVEVPSSPITKAIGNGYTEINDLVYAVYTTPYSSEEEAFLNLDQAVPFYQKNYAENEIAFAEGKTNVEIELLNGQNYIILFWAQNQDAWFKDDKFDLMNVTYPEGIKSNSLNLAAFSGKTFVPSVSGAISKKITLTRPFAQINLGTIKDNKIHSLLDFNTFKSSVTVKNAGTSFNVAKDKVNDDCVADVTFGDAPIADESFVVDGKEYKYLAMNYVFVDGPVDVDYTLSFEKYNPIINSVTNVPVQKNYKTNIVGNLLSSTASYNITLLPWNDEEFTIELWDGVTTQEPSVDENAQVLTYEIDEPSELAWLAAYVNGTLGTKTRSTATPQEVKFKLTANVDLNNQPWTPIGFNSNEVAGNENYFTGEFDGNGFEIRNLYIDVKDKGGVGLFGAVHNATIKNVTLRNVFVKAVESESDPANTSGAEGSAQYIAGGHIGAVAGYDVKNGYVNFEDVHVVGTIKIEGETRASQGQRVGGIVGGRGASKYSFKNISVIGDEGSYIKGYCSTAGVIGQNQEAATFENVTTDIDVYAVTFGVGGIAGIAREKSTFTNCSSAGNLTLDASKNQLSSYSSNYPYRVGGIAGCWSESKTGILSLSNCSYTGTLTSIDKDGNTIESFDYEGYVGRGYTLKNCSGSTVDVNGTKYIQAFDDVYGLYTVEGEYVITSLATMKSFRDKVNKGYTFEGETVKLCADIDLNNEHWIPVGYWETFNGTFDGNNKTVSNLKHHGESDDCYIGLFGYANNATFKNLIINNVDIKLVANDSWAGGHIGALVGNIEGNISIDNVIVKGDVKIEGDLSKIGSSRIGGVIGGNVANATISNVKVEANSGSFVKGYSSIGGIAGQLQGKFAFANCSSNIDVIAQQFGAGGIIGLVQYSTTFDNCSSSGNISVLSGRANNENDLYRVGGIAGSWDESLSSPMILTGCTFTGTLSGKDADGNEAASFDCDGFVGRGYSASIGALVSVNGIEYKYAGGGIYTRFIDGYEIIAEGVSVDNESNYLILNAEGMFWFANEVNVSKNAFTGKTVKLANNIDLENAVWTPIGQTGSTTFNGVFDGQNFTISNLNVNSDSQTGAYYSSGLFGWIETHSAGNGILKNVKINGANVVGHHNCGALVGYITEKNAVVENCHVSNATISCSYANGDADGDKAGALIGNATVATTVKNCTASNSTVSSGRDAGQLIGAGKEANVTGCSATNVAVSSNGTGTGANIRNEVIGRLL